MRSMLVINRSEIIAKLFADIFKKRGWDVDTCCNRDCAIEQLGGSKLYEAILLGFLMAGTNGVELAGFIRALEHRKRTAVVMITSNVENTEEALVVGADAVLLEPVNPNALVFAVDMHVLEQKMRMAGGQG